MVKTYLKRLSLALAMLFMTAMPAMASEFDLRVAKLDAYLESHNSPLAGLAQVFVDTADKYGYDWTILPAISGTESTFGKRMPVDCNNPFGWGIYGDNKICFENLAKGIEGVGEGIGTKYNTESISTIGRTYNKVSTNHWISNTTFFSNKIKNFDIPVSALPIEL